MKRPMHTPTPAFVAFVVTVLTAVAASAMTLLPQQAAQVADSQVHMQIEQLLPADILE